MRSCTLYHYACAAQVCSHLIFFKLTDTRSEVGHETCSSSWSFDRNFRKTFYLTWQYKSYLSEEAKFLEPVPSTPVILAPKLKFKFYSASFKFPSAKISNVNSTFVESQIFLPDKHIPASYVYVRFDESF